MAEERRQDPQDKAFGAAARRDAEAVDELGEEGQQHAAPRPGAKAEPAPDEHRHAAHTAHRDEH